MLYLLDTNVIINALNEYSAETVRFFEQTPAALCAISVVVWIEVLAGAVAADREETESFLDTFAILPVSTEVALRTIEIRRSMRLKLPDALIYATALATGRTLVTFNKRDFPADTPSVRLLS